MNEDDATALELLVVQAQLDRAVSVARAPSRVTTAQDAAVAAFVVAAREMLASASSSPS